MVLAAGNWRINSQAHHAMGQLAHIYWFPLYAFLRRRGSSPAQAEDLVQGFFVRLLEKDALTSVDRSKGKFRSFLLASLKNFLANEWDKTQTQKRGGSKEIFSLDTNDAETKYVRDAVDVMTPERVFERRWALAVLEQVLLRLKEEYASRGQAAIFSALEPVLIKGQTMRYADIAKQLNTTEGAIKVAGHRLRKRYRELLRDEISQTVCQPQQIDEEIKELLRSL